MLIATLLASVFLALALLHVYWAAGGRWGRDAAIPSVPAKDATVSGAQGQGGAHTTMVKAFNPGPAITLAVAGALTLVALLVALRAGLLGPPVRHWALQWSIGAAAAVMLLRAVGDLRAVGFFKTITGSQFARMDNFYYSPACVLLALGLGLVAAA